MSVSNLPFNFNMQYQLEKAREHAERELRRRDLLEARRTVWECYRKAGDDAELKRICKERELVLWEDAKTDEELIKAACHDLTIELTEDLDDEQWKQACRERDIDLVEDLPDGYLHPHDPVAIAAVEIAFSSGMTDLVMYLSMLREELRRRNIFGRAHLDALRLL
jgi:hypothetical protein